MTTLWPSRFCLHETGRDLLDSNITPNAFRNFITLNTPTIHLSTRNRTDLQCCMRKVTSEQAANHGSFYRLFNLRKLFYLIEVLKYPPQNAKSENPVIARPSEKKKPVFQKMFEKRVSFKYLKRQRSFLEEFYILEKFSKHLLLSFQLPLRHSLC